MDHPHRYDDMPRQLKWIMNFVNRLGFPILVCIWLAYQQFVDGKNNAKTLGEFKEVLIGLKTSIDQQNKILRRRTHSDD